MKFPLSPLFLALLIFTPTISKAEPHKTFLINQFKVYAGTELFIYRSLLHYNWKLKRVRREGDYNSIPMRSLSFELSKMSNALYNVNKYHKLLSAIDAIEEEKGVNLRPLKDYLDEGFFSLKSRLDITHTPFIEYLESGGLRKICGIKNRENLPCRVQAQIEFIDNEMLDRINSFTNRLALKQREVINHLESIDF